MKPDSIVKIRKALSLSQAKAAFRIGVTPNTWAKWEQGIASPGTVGAELIQALPSIVKHGYPPPCKKMPEQWDKVIPHSRSCVKCRRLLFYLARMSEEEK
jgi:transcriptional regulator with XRE-family HTH domain